MPEPTATPTEPAATPEPTSTTSAEPQTSATDDLGDAGKKALDAERARAKEFEKQAKQFQRELEQHKQASMSEAEKAVAEAEKRGAATATKTLGERLVRSDFTAAAARINPEFDVTEVLDDLNLTKFVGEDGEPDTEAIKKAAERLVPPSGGPRPPSFDGGARTTAPAPVGMNQLIRKAVGRA